MISRETLIRKLKKAGLEPYAYSGRGMYGENCVAVTAWALPDDLLVPPYSRDNMGKDFVYYWPSILWKKEVFNTIQASESFELDNVQKAVGSAMKGK